MKVLTGVSCCLKSSIIKGLHNRLDNLTSVESDSHGVGKLRSSIDLESGWNGLLDRLKLKAFQLFSSPHCKGEYLIERGLIDQVIFFELGLQGWYDVNPPEHIVDMTSEVMTRLLADTSDCIDHYYIIRMNWMGVVESILDTDEFENSNRYDLFISVDQYKYVQDFFIKRYEEYLNMYGISYDIIDSDTSYNSIEHCLDDLINKIYLKLSYG